MNTVVERIIREEVREYLSAYFGASKSDTKTRKRGRPRGSRNVKSDSTPKAMRDIVANMKSGETVYVKFDEFAERFNNSNSIARVRGHRGHWLADRFRGAGATVAKKHNRKFAVSMKEFDSKNAVLVKRLR